MGKTPKVPRRMTPKECKRLRERLKMNQTEFAKLVGTYQSTVARWEAGTIGIDPWRGQAIRNAVAAASA